MGTQHELLMQSMIDQLSTPDSFSKVIEQLTNVVELPGVNADDLIKTKKNLKSLSLFKLGNNDQNISNGYEQYDPNWLEMLTALNYLKLVLKPLIDLNHQQHVHHQYPGR